MRDRSMVLSDGVLVISASTDPGDSSTLVDVEGWYESGIRLAVTDRLGDGVFAGRQSWDGRPLLVRGHVSGLPRAEVSRWLRALAALGTPGRASVLTVVDQGLTLSAEVLRREQPRQAHSLESGWVEWELPLVAPDPYLYGPPSTWQVFPAGVDAGLVWPLFSDGDVLTWGDSGDSQPPPQVENRGTAPAWPIVRVEGDFPSGFRLGDGSGRWVTWQRPVALGVPVVIDFAAHSVTVGGSDQSWALVEREFWSIPPGGVVQPVLVPIQAGGGRADVTVRDTWI